jgi:hypothetical protein
MTQPTGATPADTSAPATGTEDAQAEALLAEAVATTDDEPLREAGEKALKAERDARKAAEKELAKFRKAEQDRADADKSEAEKRTAAEARAEAAELRALRVEVAHAKGLTPGQAKRLVGATRDELEKDADEILVEFPVAKAAAPPKPKPDPSQGSKGDAPPARPTSLGQAVAAALSKK